MEISYRYELSNLNKFLYFIREKIPFFTKKYFCVSCNTNYTVLGAKANMNYFCNESSCKGALLRIKWIEALNEGEEVNE